jgi:hypothetical protein
MLDSLDLRLNNLCAANLWWLRANRVADRDGEEPPGHALVAKRG